MKILIVALLTFIANGVLAQDVLIKGTVQNLDGQPLIFAYYKADKKAYERVATQDGNFELKLNISEAQEIEIRPYRFTKNSIKDTVRKFYYNAPELLLFIVPGDQIEFSADAMAIWNAEVKGGKYEKENEQFRLITTPLLSKQHQLKFAEYALLQSGDSTGAAQKNKEYKSLSTEIRRAEKNYFTTHINSAVALNKMFQNIRSLQPAEAENIFSAFTPELKQSAIGEKINVFIQKTKEAGPGVMMMDFEGRTLAGENLNTLNLRGKYVLLDFWGSWCKPCRMSNPHLKELYAQYKSKGFEIVGIAQETGSSLEKNKAAWKKAVETDGLPWPQLLNNEMAEKLDLTNAYNVGAYPTKVLVDKKGKIIWRSVGIAEEEALDKMLATIFDKKVQ